MESKSDIINFVEESGYVFMTKGEFVLNEDEKSSFIEFAKFYDDLPEDEYLDIVDTEKVHNNYRYRRWGRFAVNMQTFSLKELPHRPFNQSKKHNENAGGKERNFEPLTNKILSNSFLKEIIKCNLRMLPFTEMDRTLRWEVYVHLIKVESSGNSLGKPSPEGMHQDDVDYFSVHLIDRNTFTGGKALIYNLNKILIDQIDLKNPLDSYYVYDCQVLHDVQKIQPTVIESTAYRNVLILSYKSFSK